MGLCLQTRVNGVHHMTQDAPVILSYELLAKRKAAAVAAIKSRGRKVKWKQLSPEDAALIIQMSFRAHFATYKGTAIAKAKLKELRSLFDNFFYAEERQRFSEKIVVLPLTVEEIPGLDLMIREAHRSMIKELEATLETVDPQPAGKLAWFKRRKFDLPETCSKLR
ncbi:hypothetical protein EJ110_NYTH32335 [Nymphaea thermarum]|nr:hypothetical protein EJ110_NYTH32335 [Nymphaea thermarum]